MSTDSDLLGKVALVTGATRQAGIGAAVARELVRAGAAVFITHFRQYDQRQSWGIAPGETETLVASLGERACAAELDLSEPSAARTLFDRAIARFGRVDIVINNAAHWEPSGIADVSAAQLDRHYAVNLRAAVLVCAEFVRHRRAGDGGRIINITSGQGHGPMPGALAYAVTKAGLDALTLSLAAEVAAFGVTVNAIDPGPTDTGWIPDGQRKSVIAASPTGTIGTPEDVATVVRLLAGDAASRVTGRILRIQFPDVVGNLSKELANFRLHEDGHRHEHQLD